MRRRLIVMRHAKSAWPDDVPDHDRPLTGRGRRDAAAAGRWLAGRQLMPDVAPVSSARRARQTAEVLGAAVDGPLTGEIRIDDGLYGAGAGELLDAVRAVEPHLSTVLLVAHNPSIGMLAALLDDGRSDVTTDAIGYPTAAMTVFDVATEWDRLDPGAARIVDFIVPRG